MNFGNRYKKVARRIAQTEARLISMQQENDTRTLRMDDSSVPRPLRQTRMRRPFPE